MKYKICFVPDESRFLCCIYFALAINSGLADTECQAGTASPSLIQKRVKRLRKDPIVQLPTSTMEEFPENLGHCALVGSSSILSGEGHGPDIDKHDTVIRVNRIPTSEYFADFGSKTNIFFGNVYVWKKGHIQLFGGAYKEVARNHSGLFSSLVMNSWKPPPNWREISQVWNQAPYPVGHPANWVMEFAFHLKAAHPLPTAGLFALLTFAPICDYVQIYGFGGGLETVDNHTMNLYHKHDINAEHALVDRIANGTVTDSDISLRHPIKAKEFREFLADLRGRIVRVK